MSLRLLTFKTTKIKAMTACGEIDTSSIKNVKLLKTKIEMISKYSADDREVYLLLRCDSKKHLHIDCVLSSFIEKKNHPKITHKIGEMLDLFNNFQGAKINVDVIGCYVLAVNDIPDTCLIRSLSSEQKTSNVSIKLTQGTFSISGAPVTEMKWSINEQKNEATIIVQAEKEEIIDDEYLTRINDWIDTQFNLFILGKA